MIAVGLNMLAVLVGTVIGVVFGRLIAERFRQIAFYAIGSCTIAFGVVIIVSGYGDLSETEMGSLAAIVLVVSLVGGALTGELLRIEDRLESLGTLLQTLLPKQKKRSAREGSGELDDASSGRTFAEGFMTASVLFCAGAMTIMGSIQAGLGDPSTLYLKATLDGVAAIALSTALGIGVGFSIITIGVIQGGLALAAGALAGYVSDAMMASIELVGGAMLIALGLDILGIKKLKVGNMLPALVYAVVFVAIFG